MASPRRGPRLCWWLSWLAVCAAEVTQLPTAERAARRQGQCKQENGRQNFFLLFPLSSSQFGQLHYATIESVLFHHPAANVLLLSFDLPEHLFDAYLSEGYCVTTLLISSAVKELSSLLREPLATTFLERFGQPQTDSDFARLLNAVVLSQQVLYGGTSLPMEGLLLNPWDMPLPSQLLLQDTGVFLEKLEGATLPWALTAEDFEKSWLPRSHVDRADGATSLCLEVLCPRSLPRGSRFGQELLLHTASDLSPEGDDLNMYGTLVYRGYVQQRPRRTPFEVDKVMFNHELVLLPYWLQMQPYFSDGWKDYGGEDGMLTSDTDLYQARHMRALSDWSLVSTARLWLPLNFGTASSRQAMPMSVVDLALRYFTLDLAPHPFRKKGFNNGRTKRKPRPKRLRSPADFTAENTAFIDEVHAQKGQQGLREGGLPGVGGGFRSFKELRLVGFEEQGHHWRVTVETPLRLFCRPEHRARLDPSGTPSASQALRHCEAALAGPAFQSQCLSVADANAVLTLLAYHPEPMLSPSVVFHQEGRDFRHSDEELKAHFRQLKVTAESCTGGSLRSLHEATVLTTEFAALVDDVEEHVTVVAHCAERCHLLERLAMSFREVYAKMQIIATCECAEEEGCQEPVPRSHETVPNMTVVSVPYDFGLSRGKTLLIEMTKTEFVLVLDDDFTHSMHSCVECMLWKMRSRHYSLWKPFDILGFPVQEDERIFGAFRGRLRVTNQQLFLEPMVEELLPDGCVRVEICPMVFLGRTARMRSFTFQKDLRVGEHEQFFYSNAYNGVQVAVCFDSSFPHFRVNTMSAGYVKRRERMPELMANAFQKLGFERAMFLFRKYDHGRMSDYDELLDKTVPPWHIGHDTCGPPTAPPVPFAQVMVVILSSADQQGKIFRSVLRGSRGWMNRFLQLGGVGSLRWVFAVYPRSDESTLHVTLEEENDLHKDMLILPASDRSSRTAGPTTDHLLQVFALLRDFQFRFLAICRQDVFVSFQHFMDTLQLLEPPAGKVLGEWQPTPTSWRLDPHFFVLPRDVFVLLSAPEVISRLAVSGFHQIFGDLSELGAGLSSWAHAYDIQRLPLRSTKRGEVVCPSSSVTLHPVAPEELQALFDSPTPFGC